MGITRTTPGKTNFVKEYWSRSICELSGKEGFTLECTRSLDGGGIAAIVRHTCGEGFESGVGYVHDFTAFDSLIDMCADWAKEHTCPTMAAGTSSTN